MVLWTGSAVGSTVDRVVAHRRHKAHRALRASRVH
jgi:hypothetical protein